MPQNFSLNNEENLQQLSVFKQLNKYHGDNSSTLRSAPEPPEFHLITKT